MTFRAGLRGLADVNSTALAGLVTEWVSTGQTVLIGNVHYVIDSSCSDEVVIDDLSKPECTEATVTQSAASLSSGQTAGITAGTILLVVLLVGISILLAVVLRKRHKGHYRITR